MLPYLMVIALWSVMTSLAITPVLFISQDTNCCCDSDEESPSSCPCESKQDCCCACTIVYRAPCLIMENTRLIFRTLGVRMAYVDDKRHALTRHEAPSLPPPENGNA